MLVTDKKAARVEKERSKAAVAAAESEVQISKAERRKLEQIRRKKENQARVAGEGSRFGVEREGCKWGKRR